MKKLLLSTAVILASLTASAQLVTVQSVDRVGTTTVEKPVIAKDGSFVVGYTAESSAIVKIDLASGQTEQVAEGEGLYNLRITDDNSSVLFTRPTMKKNLRYVSLEAADIASGKVSVCVKPTRKLNHGIAISGSTVTAVENGKVRTKTLSSGTKSEAAPFASISYGHLQVTVDGKTTTIDPQGRGSYLWPSVSPDGTKVVYWLAGRGCYVANLDGSDPQHIGALRSPIFLDNETIVGTLTADDGHVITESTLVARRISDLVSQKLTSSDVIALHPSADATGKHVAFVNENGELFIITINK